jgi:hypothetical protein
VAKRAYTLHHHFRGALTEKQEKLREKIRKKEHKAANLKAEADRISSKEGAQQGLTSGQQMQLGRNQQVCIPFYTTIQNDAVRYSAIQYDAADAARPQPAGVTEC